MTIYDRDSYLRSIWDWGFLDDCFGDSGIRVSDLDGIVERKGWFLVIETKGNGKEIPHGQRRMHQAMAAKGFTILRIWGEANAPTQMQVWYPNKLSPQAVEIATLEGIKDIVCRWYNWANGPGPPHDEGT